MIGVAPLIELPHTCLQHLIGVEAGVLPKQRVRESGDEGLWRVAQREMARDQPSGRVDLPLAIECAQQSRADFLDCVGKVIQPIAAFARQPRRRHVQVAGKIDRHGSVKNSTGRGDTAILLVIVCLGPLQRLVNGVGVGEDVKGRLPVGMLVRGDPPPPRPTFAGFNALDITAGCSRPRSDRFAITSHGPRNLFARHRREARPQATAEPSAGIR